MNPPRRPIQTRVRRSILEAIRSGAIRPGQKLSIAALADTLGVSVTPIREALSSLAGDGVLDLLSGGVVIVPAMTRAHLEEWLWLRRVIESQLVERGLERKTPSDAAAIADLASEVSLNTLDADLCIEIGSAVIDRIVALADREVLARNLCRVRSRCAAALAEGQRHAGVEAAVSFAAGIASALRGGRDNDARVIHGRYLDSIDAAVLSMMGNDVSSAPSR
ncbi:MAG TPA: GntR family transcriptional regulator [Povalibacter sp.]